MPSFERFVIQKKARRSGEFTDWVNPMGGQVDYETHAHAATALLRRANSTDYRIVRRTWTSTDVMVSSA